MGGQMMVRYFAPTLTRLGVLMAHPAAFLILACYVGRKLGSGSTGVYRSKDLRMSDDTKATKEEKSENASKLSTGGLVLALVTGLLTGAISYAYGVANDIRKSKVDFVNAQIEKLYGPLYAASQANNEIWKLFTQRQWRTSDASDESSAFFDDKNPLLSIRCADGGTG
jgi:hypothetical protein